MIATWCLLLTRNSRLFAGNISHSWKAASRSQELAAPKTLIIVFTVQGNDSKAIQIKYHRIASGAIVAKYYFSKSG
jgi:hypothetical protein